MALGFNPCPFACSLILVFCETTLCVTLRSKVVKTWLATQSDADRRRETQGVTAPNRLERLVYRSTLPREKFRTGFSNVETILQTNTEFSINNYGGFVAETHSWLNRSLVSSHKVGPFVSI